MFRNIITEKQGHLDLLKSLRIHNKIHLNPNSSSFTTLLQCSVILELPPINRIRKDLEKTIPYFSTLTNLKDFFSIGNDPLNTKETFIELASIILRQTFKKNSFIKRYGERENTFFVILKGEVAILDIVFIKENVSLLEYLTYLVKLELLKESEILKQLLILNSETIQIKEANIEEFLKNHKEYDYSYNTLKQRALFELKQYNVNLNKCDKEVWNIDDYIQMTSINKNNLNYDGEIFDINSNKKKFYYFGKYVLIGKYITGFYFGDLIPNSKRGIEEYTFISTDTTEIGYFDKSKNKQSNLYQLTANKMRKILFKTQKNYYIFQSIPINNFISQYAPLISIKTYFKGDKLFTQNSLYKGIFMLLEGEIEIYSNRTYYELDNFATSLEKSLHKLGECYTNLKSTSNFITNNLSKSTLIPFFQSDNFVSIAKQKNKISFFNIGKKEVFGLNEYYHSMTKLYHFEAECISDKAICLIITKDIFNIIINREPSVIRNVAQIVENRVKYLVNAIRIYKERFVYNIQRELIKQKKDNNITKFKVNSNKNFIFLQTHSNFRDNRKLKMFLNSPASYTNIKTSFNSTMMNNDSRFFRTFSDDALLKKIRISYSKNRIKENYKNYNGYSFKSTITVRKFPFIVKKLNTNSFNPPIFS